MIARRSYLRRGVPPRKRRAGVRRGRVVCPAFIAYMHANHGCLVAEKGGCSGRLTFHHWREFGSPKNDRRGFMLCEGHHQHDCGKESIERGKVAFEARFGIDGRAEISRLNEEFDAQAVRNLRRAE